MLRIAVDDTMFSQSPLAPAAQMVQRFAAAISTVCTGIAAMLLVCNVNAEPRTKASLVLDTAVARPGDTVLAGIVLESPLNWHTYWRNPGESGAATTIEWTLPPTLSAGEIMWPPPEEHVAAGLTTYVYHGQTMLIVPLRVATNAQQAELEIKAKVDWLECHQECVPGEATLTTHLRIGADRALSPNAELINQWLNRIPKRVQGLEITSKWRASANDNVSELVIILPGNMPFKPANFIAYPIDGIEVLPPVHFEVSQISELRLVKKVKQYGAPLPATITGILWRPGDNSTNAIAIEVELRPSSGKQPAQQAYEPPSNQIGTGTRHIVREFIVMLGLAFLGGIILNFMPCVLPVISLKILGFVQQSRESASHVRTMGLLYGAGVLFSFLVLAGVVIAVQQAGGSISWGMQMQNPYFRFVLMVIVALVALNLFGVFQVTLAEPVSGAASKLVHKTGAWGAFLNGVLATTLATPCTAPFLAAAVGFAFAQSSPSAILGVFMSVAIGMAAPYVVLSWNPAWLKFLPKPGPWMEKFRITMGFPMLATAFWLLDLTAPSFGEGAIAWLGLVLVLISTAAWVWGTFIQSSSTKQKGLACVVVLACLAASLAVLEFGLDWRHLPKQGTPPQTTAATQALGAIDWKPWSKEAVEKARAEGHPVLVDFTARWCLTCKSNERFAIDVPEVRRKLAEIKAVAFKADNTDPNPEINAELKKHGRAGVPLVIVYPRQQERDPIVLPTVLTPGIVLSALERAAE